MHMHAVFSLKAEQTKAAALKKEIENKSTQIESMASDMNAAKKSAEAAERAREAAASSFENAVKDLTALHDLLDANNTADAANVAIEMKVHQSIS